MDWGDLIIKIKLPYWATLLLVVSLNSCCNLGGSRSLGSNIALLEGDRIEDRIIIFCNPKSKKKCCTSGSYLVPASYNEHMINGKYAEYVQMLESNDKWIIVQSLIINEQKKNYWIIDKSFKEVITYDEAKPKVLGPFNIENFIKRKNDLGIKLSFN